MIDREEERYQILKNEGKLPPRKLSSGKPKRTNEINNEKNAKAIKRSQKGVIGANNLFFQQEERDIYKYVWDKFKAKIIARKGELDDVDEMLLNDLCIARIRLYRKTRMESSFNKFFDRVVTQDPMAQTQSLLKSMNLINDKYKDSNSNKELIAKMLMEDSEEVNDKKLTLEEWQQVQDNEEQVKLHLFTPKNASMFNTDFADIEEDGDNSEKSDTLAI